VLPEHYSRTLRDLGFQNNPGAGSAADNREGGFWGKGNIECVDWEEETGKGWSEEWCINIVEEEERNHGLACENSDYVGERDEMDKENSNWIRTFVKVCLGGQDERVRGKGRERHGIWEATSPTHTQKNFARVSPVFWEMARGATRHKSDAMWVEKVRVNTGVLRWRRKIVEVGCGGEGGGSSWSPVHFEDGERLEQRTGPSPTQQ